MADPHTRINPRGQEFERLRSGRHRQRLLLRLSNRRRSLRQVASRDDDQLIRFARPDAKWMSMKSPKETFISHVERLAPSASEILAAALQDYNRYINNGFSPENAYLKSINNYSKKTLSGCIIQKIENSVIISREK